MRTCIVIGCRPNFVKIAPLIKQLDKQKVQYDLVHTGQHYDYRMSEIFFSQLGIPDPNFNLGINRLTNTKFVARAMAKLEPLLKKLKPSSVIVLGDVNSTLAGALTASYLHIPVVHIEAGLRSFDKTMPEEINRKLTDHMSDFLFTTTDVASNNLIDEGILGNKIFLVGDLLIENLMDNFTRLKRSTRKTKYCVATIHRPKNVQNGRFPMILSELKRVQQMNLSVIFVKHPGITVPFQTVDPKSYIDFVSMVKDAHVVITDSGGVQSETSFLGVPCITVRDVTEKIETVRAGTNVLCSPEKISRYVRTTIHNGASKNTRYKKLFKNYQPAKNIVGILKAKGAL